MEKEIGRYKEAANHFLCNDCFSKAEGLNRKDYKPIYEADLGADIYTCDKCGKEKGKKKEKKWERWRKVSDLRRIFMYHPEAPILVRIIAFLLLFPFIGGLGIMGLGFLYMTLDPQRTQGEEFDFLLLLVLLISTLIISYGLSHLKRWSLCLFGILLICIFILTKHGYFGLNFCLIGLIGFIILLSYYKKFTY